VGPIADSLIGRDVELTTSNDTPGVHRLMLGDHSRVSVAGTRDARG
jgi:glucose-1-phosphate thymidylyltransferase